MRYFIVKMKMPFILIRWKSSACLMRYHSGACIYDRCVIRFEVDLLRDRSNFSFQRLKSELAWSDLAWPLKVRSNALWGWIRHLFFVVENVTSSDNKEITDRGDDGQNVTEGPLNHVQCYYIILSFPFLVLWLSLCVYVMTHVKKQPPGICFRIRFRTWHLANDPKTKSNQDP